MIPGPPLPAAAADAMTDEQLADHIRAGGDPPEGDDVATVLAMIRDGAAADSEDFCVCGHYLTQHAHSGALGTKCAATEPDFCTCTQFRHGTRSAPAARTHRK